MLNDKGPDLYSLSEAGPCTSQSSRGRKALGVCAAHTFNSTSCQAPI